MATYGFEDHCWQDVVSAEDIELYKHYQRELFVGRRPALLAIDLYNSAYQGGPLPVHEVAKEFPSACGEVKKSRFCPRFVAEVGHRHNEFFEKLRFVGFKG